MNIHHTTSQTAAARSGGRYLTDVLNKQQPVLVLASGGSALCMLDYVSVNAGKVTLGVLDERFSVAPTHRNSEALLQTPFGRQVRQFGEILHTNQDTFRSVEAFAARLGSGCEIGEMHTRMGLSFVRKGWEGTVIRPVCSRCRKMPIDLRNCLRVIRGSLDMIRKVRAAFSIASPQLRHSFGTWSMPWPFSWSVRRNGKHSTDCNRGTHHCTRCQPISCIK